jgi:hypothetical protein
MRVNKLYIICIRKHDPRSVDGNPVFDQPQFEDEARALALRSLTFEKCDAVDIIQCSPFMYTKRDGQMGIDNDHHEISRTGLSRGMAPSDRPRVGVYVIAEGSPDGIGSLQPNELGELLLKYGISHLDKLHLISCNIAQSYPQENLPLGWKHDDLVSEGKPLGDSDFNNYVARACGVLGVMGMGNGDDRKLMVAGWSTYVTVAFPGRKSESELGKKHTGKEKWEPLEALDKDKVKKMNSGRRYAQDTQDKSKKKPANMLGDHKPKVFYAWSTTRGLRLISNTDWTDKT